MAKKLPKMCKLAEKGNLKKAARLAKGARYICRKCARAAADPDALCKPEKL